MRPSWTRRTAAITWSTSNVSRNTLWHLQRPVQKAISEFLDVESGGGKKIDTTGVVEMHVRQSNVADNCRIDADPPELLLNPGQNYASCASRRRVAVHARIDDDGPWAGVGSRITHTK